MNTPTLTPEMQAYVAMSDRLWAQFPHPKNWDERRDAYAQFASLFPAAPGNAITVNRRIIAGVSCAIAGETTDQVLVYLHGGGWVYGDLDSHEALLKDLAAQVGNGCLMIDYRLAPEHPHPAALEDCLSVVRALLDDGKVLVLMGDSAGGNLATAMLPHIALDQILGQVLVYPALSGEMNQGSYLSLADAPLLTRQDMRDFAELRRATDPKDADAYPLAAESLALVPTRIMTAEIDPLFDDSVHYHRRLKALGADVGLKIHHDLLHGHMWYRNLGKESAAAFQDIVRACQELLAR